MRRLRNEAGFGLIEMLAAILLIDLAIFALLLALNSGMVSLRRSAGLATASVLADKQMERYRAGTHSVMGVVRRSGTTAVLTRSQSSSGPLF